MPVLEYCPVGALVTAMTELMLQDGGRYRQAFAAYHPDAEDFCIYFMRGSLQAGTC